MPIIAHEPKQYYLVEITFLGDFSAQVESMSFYDVLLDFVLLDAFDDLATPPYSVSAAIQNRWLSARIKETVRQHLVMLRACHSSLATPPTQVPASSNEHSHPQFIACADAPAAILSSIEIVYLLSDISCKQLMFYRLNKPFYSEATYSFW